MKLHYLQHVPFEGLGSIEAWAQQAGLDISRTSLFVDEPLPVLADCDYLVVMGGPMNIYEEDKYPWLAKEKSFIRQAINEGTPVLGICLGAQLIADVLGARVYPNAEKEIGWFPIRMFEEAPAELRNLFPAGLEVMHWHGDTFDLPEGSIPLASSLACHHQGFIFQDKVIGLQFHLETTRESLANLITNCADEIVESPYIQQTAMMQNDDNRFAAINAVMDKLLDYWTGKD